MSGCFFFETRCISDIYQANPGLVKTWLSDSRVDYNCVVDHRNRQPVVGAAVLTVVTFDRVGYRYGSVSQ